MSNKMTGSAVALATLFLAITRQGEAQVYIPKLYGGFELTAVVYSIGAVDHIEDGPYTVERGVTMAPGMRLGIRFNKHLAVEIHSGLGLNDNKHSYTSFYGQDRINSVVKVDRYTNVRARISIPKDWNQPVKPYITLGHALVTETHNGSTTFTPSGVFPGEPGTSSFQYHETMPYLSYGVGFNFDWPRQKNAWSYFEYTGFLSFNTLSVGINFSL